jgi:pimeloyl-ACP methyl ester carboxylesterase
MATITIEDITVHYETSGEGPPLVFVHGSFGHGDVWAEQARRFSDRHTCVRYDRRGHARSSRGDAPLSATRHADDAAALIEALDLAPCLLVTSSFGAVIGCEVARRHPHLLGGLVASEPPLFSLDPESGARLMSEIKPTIERAIETDGPRAGVDAFLAQVCPGLWACSDEAAKDRYRANAEIGFADMAAPSSDLDTATLHELDIPILVLSGSDSHPSFRVIAHRLAAALPDARFVELEDCGHVGYAEQPDAFFRAVSAFAAELAGQPAA